MANNVPHDNETLTEYDQINDPKLLPKNPPMIIPVEWDNPFQTDNNSQRNPLYEQRVHTFVSASPSISISELYETVYSAPADQSQPSTMGMRRFTGAGNPGIQGGGPNGALGTGEAVYVSERPFPQQIELTALDRRPC